MKRINGIFILLLGMLLISVSLMAQEGTVEPVPGMDYNGVFTSLVAIVAAVPFVVEVVKGFFPKMNAIVTQILSWVVAVALCMFGWWQHLGFLDGLDWYIALLYGLGSGLAANGIADIGLVQ